jgi:ATP-dependent Clp protease ATP-binding subunit ClpC
VELYQQKFLLLNNLFIFDKTKQHYMNGKYNSTKPKMSVNDDEDDDDDSFPGKQNPKKPDVKSKTPFLDNFGKDLIKLADEGKVDPVIGRDKEIERVCQILGRRKKNNPLLIGEPGTGKTAIADALALRIIQKTVPRSIANKRVVSIDISSLVAGTKFRGQFEERMKSLIDELERNPDVILFIDEIHTMVGAGGASGSLDASNIFKPALARGTIQVIGATTLEEYRKNIEKDGALDRRFQVVQVDPSTAEDTTIILNNIKAKYEDHHNVIYTPEAIEACVTLSDRYITNRFFPDKAIDIIDEAGARVHIKNIKTPQTIIDIENQIAEVKINKGIVVRSQKYEEAAKLRDVEKKLIAELDEARIIWEEELKLNKETVTEDHVADVVSMMTGIPVQKVNKDDSAKLASMQSYMTDNVIGQDEAVSKIVKSIQRGRVGLKDPNKPLGVFLCVGDTGVGKTHLAKNLAKFLFDSEDALTRLDMSEFMEKHTVSKIIGSPGGYVGYEDGSAFLNKIRNKPYSVILLDEIEKAHPDVFNVFLQMFDEGHLTDSHGRKINFKNCVIMMTSNVGVRKLKDFGTGIGFGTEGSSSSEDSKSVIEAEVKKTFAPEFINRIDDIIMFNSLGKEDLSKIIDLELNKIYERVKNIGFTLTIDDDMKKHLIDIGYDPHYGARPMKRVIQKWVEDAVTEKILTDNPPKESAFVLTYNKEEDKAEVKISEVKTKKVKSKKEEDKAE